MSNNVRESYSRIRPGDSLREDGDSMSTQRFNALDWDEVNERGCYLSFVFFVVLHWNKEVCLVCMLRIVGGFWLH